jgi:hypothetical protein
MEMINGKEIQDEGKHGVQMEFAITTTYASHMPLTKSGTRCLYEIISHGLGCLER